MFSKILIALAFASIVSLVQAQDFCIICTSSIVRPECIDPESAGLTNSRCTGPANNRSCFSRVNDEGNVVRGCLSELQNSTECDSETCQVCVGMNMPNGPHGCNNKVFPEHRLWCITCAGGENSSCAGNTNLTTTVCPLFDSEDQCYTSRPNGNYERGCLSSSNNRCDNDSCHSCSGQGCNFEDYNSAMSIFSDVKVIGLLFASILFSLLK